MEEEEFEANASKHNVLKNRSLLDDVKRRRRRRRRRKSRNEYDDTINTQEYDLSEIRHKPRHEKCSKEKKFKDFNLNNFLEKVRKFASRLSRDQNNYAPIEYVVEPETVLDNNNNNETIGSNFSQPKTAPFSEKTNKNRYFRTLNDLETEKNFKNRSNERGYGAFNESIKDFQELFNESRYSSIKESEIERMHFLALPNHESYSMSQNVKCSAPRLNESEVYSIKSAVKPKRIPENVQNVRNCFCFNEADIKKKLSNNSNKRAEKESGIYSLHSQVVYDKKSAVEKLKKAARLNKTKKTYSAIKYVIMPKNTSKKIETENNLCYNNAENEWESEIYSYRSEVIYTESSSLTDPNLTVSMENGSVDKFTFSMPTIVALAHQTSLTTLRKKGHRGKNLDKGRVKYKHGLRAKGTNAAVGAPRKRSVRGRGKRRSKTPVTGSDVSLSKPASGSSASLAKPGSSRLGEQRSKTPAGGSDVSLSKPASESSASLTKPGTSRRGKQRSKTPAGGSDVSPAEPASGTSATPTKPRSRKGSRRQKTPSRKSGSRKGSCCRRARQRKKTAAGGSNASLTKKGSGRRARRKSKTPAGGSDASLTKKGSGRRARRKSKTPADGRDVTKKRPRKGSCCRRARERKKTPAAGSDASLTKKGSGRRARRISQTPISGSDASLTKKGSGRRARPRSQTHISGSDVTLSERDQSYIPVGSSEATVHVKDEVYLNRRKKQIVVDSESYATIFKSVYKPDKPEKRRPLPERRIIQPVNTEPCPRMSFTEKPQREGSVQSTLSRGSTSEDVRKKPKKERRKKKGTSQSREGSSQSREGTSQSIERTPKSRKITSKSRKSASKSKKGTTKSREGTSQSREGSSQSREGTSQSIERTPKSRKITSKSRKSASKSKKGTTKSRKGTSKSRKVTSKSRKVTSKSKKGTSKSRKGTSHSKKGTKQLKESHRKPKAPKKVRKKNRGGKRKAKKKTKKERPVKEGAYTKKIKYSEEEMPERTATIASADFSISSKKEVIGVNQPCKSHITVLNKNQIKSSRPYCEIQISGHKYHGTFNLGLDTAIDHIIYTTLKKLKKCSDFMKESENDKESRVACQEAEQAVKCCFKTLKSLFSSSVIADGRINKPSKFFSASKLLSPCIGGTKTLTTSDTRISPPTENLVMGAYDIQVNPELAKQPNETSKTLSPSQGDTSSKNSLKPSQTSVSGKQGEQPLSPLKDIDCLCYLKQGKRRLSTVVKKDTEFDRSEVLVNKVNGKNICLIKQPYEPSAEAYVRSRFAKYMPRKCIRIKNVNVNEKIDIVSPYRVERIRKEETDGGESVAEVFFDNGQIVTVTMDPKSIQKFPVNEKERKIFEKEKPLFVKRISYDYNSLKPTGEAICRGDCIGCKNCTPVGDNKPSDSSTAGQSFNCFYADTNFRKITSPSTNCSNLNEFGLNSNMPIHGQPIFNRDVKKINCMAPKLNSRKYNNKITALYQSLNVIRSAQDAQIKTLSGIIESFTKNNNYKRKNDTFENKTILEKVQTIEKKVCSLNEINKNNLHTFRRGDKDSVNVKKAIFVIPDPINRTMSNNYEQKVRENFKKFLDNNKNNNNNNNNNPNILVKSNFKIEQSFPVINSVEKKSHDISNVIQTVKSEKSASNYFIGNSVIENKRKKWADPNVLRFPIMNSTFPARYNCR